jgi:hypothetical protein
MKGQSPESKNILKRWQGSGACQRFNNDEKLSTLLDSKN